MEKEEVIKTDSSKLNIIYVIKGIQPYDQIKGYVGILLVPMDALYLPKEKKSNIIVSGPMGMPPEAMAEMQEVFGKMLGMKQRSPEADREIVIIEPDETFQNRGWHYGDQISVTFEKLVL
jgi:hypothetical protein